MGNCVQKVSVDGKSKLNVDDSSKCSTKLVMYSDFTCPYCYLEFTRLTRALMKFPEKERISLEHGPFQLDDSLPPEGFDKYSYLSRLIPPALLDPMIDDLCRQFRELQMEMHPRGKIGNSAPAHRLQIWAQENYPEQISTNLKDALFQIHCVQGKSMSDVDAIIGAAAKVGLKDEDQIRKVMKDKKYATKLKKMKKRAKEKLDIEAVPCLIVVQECGTARKLEEATAIETVDGFMDLVQKQCR